MSLLDDARNTVEVYVQVVTTDAYGNAVLVPSEVPVEVSGRVQPSSSSESAELGQVGTEVVRFLSRTFPANAFGKCRFDGRDWDILGAPREHRGSEMTAHFTTYLRAREA